MKIDGMDNIVKNIPKQKQNIEKKVEVQDNKVLESHKKINVKNISNISEYDKKELPVSEKVIIDTIEKANKAVSGINTKFEFSIHDKTKQIMVKVLNSETDEIIREIPSEKVLDMVANIWEVAGIVVDKKG